MSSPSEHFSQLSLESMPPTTRLQSRQQRRASSSEPESDSDSDSELDFDIVDEAAGIATFPSSMDYSFAAMDERARDKIMRDLKTPSKIVLQGCQARNQDYIFRVSEVVEHTVRAGTGGSRYAVPDCDCEQGERGQLPCRHILWLCDQLTSNFMPYRDEPLTLNEDGYSTEFGNACNHIPDRSLDVLADSLHCDIVVGQSANPSPRRVRTVREILASLNETPVDQYRPDLFNPRPDKRVVKRGDLEQTIFRMLLRNNEFFSYFLSSMRHYDLLNYRFRKFRDRADAALAGFDEYAVSASSQESVLRPKDVEWCARILTDIHRQIRSILWRSTVELDSHDRRAAARTLVHMLRQVVDRKDDAGTNARHENSPADERNLYARLVGSRDRDFVVEVLRDIPADEMIHLADELTGIANDISDSAPSSYTNKLRDIISHIRDPEGLSRSGSGSKRSSQEMDRRSKRVK